MGFGSTQIFKRDGFSRKGTWSPFVSIQLPCQTSLSHISKLGASPNKSLHLPHSLQMPDSQQQSSQASGPLLSEELGQSTLPEVPSLDSLDLCILPCFLMFFHKICWTSGYFQLCNSHSSIKCVNKIILNPDCYKPTMDNHQRDLLFLHFCKLLGIIGHIPCNFSHLQVLNYQLGFRASVLPSIKFMYFSSYYNVTLLAWTEKGNSKLPLDFSITILPWTVQTIWVAMACVLWHFWMFDGMGLGPSSFELYPKNATIHKACSVIPIETSNQQLSSFALTKVLAPCNTSTAGC